MTEYEAVIGLETHIQLNTTTKIFCSCKADSWYRPAQHQYLPGVLRAAGRAAGAQQGGG